ncbi:MAG: D-tyrosyl-tRNA(Tyr) deacylase [Gammaproteobacteria bacterium]|nr:D-tyrosyl-tRNA(Tyr) deacylase [Gammaproteobacteria bacterium]
MIGLLQRVLRASVTIDGQRVASIEPGLCVLVGVEKTDTATEAARLARRICQYRVFADEAGRMNRSVLDTRGEVLLVPQFTLAANTRKGTRASFTSAADPASGRRLFDELVGAVAGLNDGRVATGRFGADMQVELVNDGPVTFWLQVNANP